ncbi:hypothetical protein [Pseudoalteromonas sp. A22]|uniref:hypothetical protein n=1 Tax=Pseudoalteromonas sp. A22 TaxID=327511 RepID=UPI00201216A9|nr:hypothetical protein [Pseudoalteromonas sp. A22]
MDKNMANLNTIEIKSFVPAKDFECAKRFYQLIGFEMAFESGDIAYFKSGSCSFCSKISMSHCTATTL